MRVAGPDGREIELSVARTRLNDAELRRARDMAFVRLRQQHYTIDEIARLYRVTPRYVYKRLREILGPARQAAQN